MQRVSDLRSRARGADLLIIDDPHSEQDALNMTSMERAYEWYTSGPRQRLQPGGAICNCNDQVEYERLNRNVT
jgi:hypothetical protein